MEKEISEIFMNNLFKYDAFACHCEKDIENVAPGEPPRTTLKLYADINHPLMFSYSPKSGLNLTGVAGGIQSRNILGRLLALPDGDIDKHIAFLKSYGFLFPLKADQYQAIDATSLMELVNRVKATVHLMNAIAGEINYKNILIMTTYLLYSDPITIELENTMYTSCQHPFTALVNSFSNFPDLSRNTEVFNNRTYSVEDTLLGHKNPIAIEFFNSVSSGTGSLPLGTKSPWFKHLFAMYTDLPNVGDELRTIIDFFYHYQTEVAVIKEVHYNKLRYYSHAQRDNFSEEMKTALLKIARIVIAAEINHNISGIHPIYNSDALAPDWHVENLLQALYFAVFYMKPGVEIYKECKNPNCKRDKFFLVEATRTNKEYCCVQCSRAAASQRFRNRQLKK